MTHALSTPVNLIDEIDETSSSSCVRRVLARVLGHSGLDLTEAREIWIKAEQDPKLWHDYVPTISVMS